MPSLCGTKVYAPAYGLGTHRPSLPSTGADSGTVSVLRRLRGRAEKGLFGLVVALLSLALQPRGGQAFEPSPLRIGTVEIHPSLGVEATYNDNIGLTQPKSDDAIIVVSPGIECLWGRFEKPVRRPRFTDPSELTAGFLYDLYASRLSYFGQRGYRGGGRPELSIGKPAESYALSGLRFRRYSVRISYDPSIYRFLDQSRFDFTHHSVSVAADYRSPGGIYVRAADDFLESTTLTTYDRYHVVDFGRQQLREGVGFSTNLATATLGYTFFTNYLVYAVYSHYVFSVQGFSLDQLLSGVSPSLPAQLAFRVEGADSRALRMTLQSVGVFVDKPIGTMTNVSLGYLFGRLTGNMDDFGISGKMQLAHIPGMEASARIGLAHDPRDAVFHEIRFGFQRVLTASRYLFGWPVPKTTLEGTVAYQLRTFDANEWIVSSSFSPASSIEFTLPSFEEVYAGLKLHTQMSPKTEVNLELVRQPREDVGGLGNVTVNWEAGASIGHRLDNKFSLAAAASYRYLENTWPDALESHAGLVYAKSLVTYEIQRWLSTHVGYEFIARTSDIKYNRYNSNRVWLNAQVHF
jgi:hypothetical protein